MLAVDDDGGHGMDADLLPKALRLPHLLGKLTALAFTAAIDDLGKALGELERVGLRLYSG